MSEDIFYVYLLRCWNNKNGFRKQRPLYGNIIYCGETNNIFRRLVEHIKGMRYFKRPSYTEQFKGNIRLAYLETYNTEQKAMNRERKIKEFSRDKKVKMIYDFKEKHSNILEFVTTNVRKLL